MVFRVISCVVVYAARSKTQLWRTIVGVGVSSATTEATSRAMIVTIPVSILGFLVGIRYLFVICRETFVTSFVIEIFLRFSCFFLWPKKSLTTYTVCCTVIPVMSTYSMFRRGCQVGVGYWGLTNRSVTRIWASVSPMLIVSSVVH